MSENFESNGAHDYKIQVAERGGIFRFIEKDGTEKHLVLVVSDDSRKTDKRISTIMLGSNSQGNDVVCLEVEDKIWYVHCGMVSFSLRNRLGERVGTASDSVMEDVDTGILKAMGLNHFREDYVRYEKMYNDLVSSLGTTVVSRSKSNKEDW